MKLNFLRRRLHDVRSSHPELVLQVVRLPGGHMSTDEQPEALAALITRFERERARRSVA